MGLEKEESAIKNSRHADTRNGDIRDIVPDSMRKLYIYKHKKINKDSPFLKPNAFSWVHITKDDVEDHWDVEYDKNGNPYVEIFSAMNTQTGVQISSQNTINKELDTIVNVSAFCDSAKFNSDKMPSYFYTLNVPYDHDAYMDGKQSVYYGAMRPYGTAQNDQDLEVSDIDMHNPPMVLDLESVEMLEKQFQNSRMAFRVEARDADQLINPTTIVGVPMKNKAGDFNFVFKPGYSVMLGVGGFLSRDSFRTKVKEKDTRTLNKYITDTKVSSPTSLVPVKATITEDNNELEINIDSLDSNIHTPLYLINRFKVPKSLKEFFLKERSTTDYYEEEYTLILDMLAVSHAINTEFMEFPRIKKEKTGATNLDPTIRITSKGRSVSSFTSKGTGAVDALYFDYIDKVRPDDDEYRLKLVKMCIVALSPYIKSNLSIAQSKDHYDKLYLLWYLKPTTSITLTSKTMKNPDIGTTNDDVSTYYLADLTVKFDSRLTDATIGDDITLPIVTTLGESKYDSVGRKLKFPNLPNQIKQVNKIPLPGEMDSSTSHDLEYQLFATLKNRSDVKKQADGGSDVLDRLYLGKEYDFIKGKTIFTKITTGWNTPGKKWTIDEIKQRVLDIVDAQYNSRNPVRFITTEANLINLRETRDSVHKNWLPTDDETSYPGAHVWSTWESGHRKYEVDYIKPILKKYPDVIKHATTYGGDWYGRVGQILTDDDIRLMISIHTNVEYDLIKIISKKKHKLEIWHAGNAPAGDGIIQLELDVEYMLQQEQYIDVQVQIDTDGRVLSLINSKSTFTKESYKNYISDRNVLESYNIYDAIRVEMDVRPRHSVQILEIEYAGFWHDKIDIIMGQDGYETPLFNKDNQTIGRQSILFV